MIPELKPCPFCGGNDIGPSYIETYSTDSSYDVFGCRSCGARFEDGSEKDWNTRTTLKAEGWNECLDAIARLNPTGDGVNWKAVAGEQKTIIEGLQARLNPPGECVVVPRGLLERLCPKMDARHWHQWNASEAYQAACELRTLLAQQGKAVGDE